MTIYLYSNLNLHTVSIWIRSQSSWQSLGTRLRRKCVVFLTFHWFFPIKNYKYSAPDSLKNSRWTFKNRSGILYVSHDPLIVVENAALIGTDVEEDEVQGQGAWTCGLLCRSGHPSWVQKQIRIRNPFLQSVCQVQPDQINMCYSGTKKKLTCPVYIRYCTSKKWTSHYLQGTWNMKIE